MVPAGVLASALLAAMAAACSPARSGGRAAVPERALRVMTYNIEAGNGNLDRTAETIRGSAAQIVALQEVDVHWAERSRFDDQATLLADALGMHVRFAPIYQFPANDSTKPPREYGIALLSKFPIVSWINHPLTRLSTQQSAAVPAAVPAPMPGFLEATIDFRGTRIRVFNTHLDYRADPQVRRQQVAEMLSFVGNPSMPTVLLGDLNAPPKALELQPLLGRLRDSWPSAAGPGFTYPASEPVRRIDYVLTSPHFLVRAARVPVTLASDHRPVIVDLELAH